MSTIALMLVVWGCGSPPTASLSPEAERQLLGRKTHVLDWREYGGVGDKQKAANPGEPGTETGPTLAPHVAGDRRDPPNAAVATNRTKVSDTLGLAMLIEISISRWRSGRHAGQ